MAFVKVFSGSIIAVQQVKQILQKNGIEPIVKDIGNSALMAGFGAINPNYQEVFVHQDQQTKVQTLLKAL